MPTDEFPGGREIDYAAMVRRKWGKEWNKPETAYEFSNGRKFQDTTQQGGSFYVPHEQEE
jgi:hypothetical protein